MVIVCCGVLGELKLLLTTISVCTLCSKLSPDDELREDLGVDILLLSDTVLFSTNRCTLGVGDCGGVGRGVVTRST